MALELKQSMKLTQQLVMTPQLQQAIKLLQLSRADLEQTIQEELLQNPMLEEGPDLTPMDELPGELTVSSVEPPSPEHMQDSGHVEEVKGDEGKNDFDWDGYLDKYQDQPPAPPSGRDLSSDELPSFQETLTRGDSLEEHLAWQLRLDALSEEERRAGMVILGNLTDDGYLASEPGEGDPLLAAALQAGVSARAAERVLRRIQNYDPVGCGARDLQECLLIQAKAWMKRSGGDPAEADGALVLAVLRGHIRELESKNYPAIARALGVELDEVVDAVKVITSLEPKPGRNFTGTDTQYITPDVYVHKMGERYVVVLNDDGLSKLRISEGYRRTLKTSDEKMAKEYVQEKLRSAVWLIRSIHQRQRTIFKVTESIIKFQRDFLDKGVQHLKPLILRHVADDIGMHESTVSRVTSNKYVHTPQGIYELKYFFNSSIARQSGDDIASEAVKSKIKALVAEEPGSAPYSDQRMVELLERQGIDIARRTVAKYREALGILPSSKRRRYF